MSEESDILQALNPDRWAGLAGLTVRSAPALSTENCKDRFCGGAPQAQVMSTSDE